ncbi:MAG: hypothetical protein OXI22_02955 [Defluviicoccus sp.]|nr:hypothetical protein [Defluviicoccus sp.]MDE0382819.1 hypothetical protein [Defluviicoccus sp.]
MTGVVVPASPPPLATVTPVSVEGLVLDRLNPRLVTVNDDVSDEAIIAQLYRSEDLGELLQSIAANGYLDIEPLIVLKEHEHLVVLEGNRRLAAIRLFREPQLAARIAERERLRISVPEIPAEHRATLDRVSVYRVDSRDDARSFIGFKHINGAAKWESYAKAKFAADWYRAGKISLSDIANRIGDKHDTVKRMVNAIYVLEQAHSRGVFYVDDRVSPRFNFSHLYTALSRAPYMQFLGLDAAWSRYDPTPDPVPEDKVDCLREILRWIYGSKEETRDPVILSQNPDIKRLGEVLISAEGLNVLRSTGSLSDAHASTQPAERKFSEALIRTRHEIREASNSLRGFDGRDVSLLGIAEDICETAQTIQDRMKKKVREAAMDGE